MISGYKEFYNLFLLESPYRVNGNNPFDLLSSQIDELLKQNLSNKVTNNIFNVGNFYWHVDTGSKKKTICANLEKVNTLVKVNSVGKNPFFKSSPPYAVDFYLAISKSLDIGVKFASDQILSDDGFRVWERIFESGYDILIFNNLSGKYETDLIETVLDLKKYFTDEKESANYQFAIGNKRIVLDLKHKVDLMEWKRLAGYPIDFLGKD